jgi:hypothetical protein
MKISMRITRWWRNVTARLGPSRAIRVIESDSLPARMPRRDLVLAREDGEDWCVGMRCPCGCGQVIELLVLAQAKPRWDVAIDVTGRPSLSPSVWLQKGCRSHFWIRHGRVHWC